MSAARNAGKQRWRVDEARGIAFRSPALEQGLDGVEYFLFNNCGHVHSHPFGWWVSIGVQTGPPIGAQKRSEEHTSELQSLMRISYAVFCLKKKTTKTKSTYT